MASLNPRHIQNMSEAEELQHFWGYADRALPCTNDPGSCEYLDVVYHSHVLGVTYTGILWATILGILFVWGIGRRISPSRSSTQHVFEGEDLIGRKRSTSSLERLLSAAKSTARSYLLPEIPKLVRPIFGRSTRLQLLILTTLFGYLTIWTFVGITYKTWITPVKDHPGLYNTRSSLGPWSDRIGVLAFALTPLSVLLASRDSILSLITGVPYQNFNFLHRWLGYIIFVQSGLHTIGWCVIEMRLYQPQPDVAIQWIQQKYMIWGVIAMFFLTILFVLSTPCMIRWTGYEFFRKSHYVLAMLYVGACWGHWSKLACWMIASLVVWLIDRAIRLARTALLHYNPDIKGHFGFASITATVKVFEDDEHGDVVRLDFEHPQDNWAVGQHFYLCFPEGSMWQSHPFTPLSLAKIGRDAQRHSYIFRAKKGETRKIARLVARKVASERLYQEQAMTTSVILTGPYGQPIMEDLNHDTNVLCIAGGTGITYVLPALLNLVHGMSIRKDRKIELIWAVRRRADLGWIEKELDVLRSAVVSHGIVIKIFVTRDRISEDKTGASKHQTCVIGADEKLSFPSPSPSSLSSEDLEGNSKDDISSSVTVTQLKATSAVSASNSSHPALDQLVKDFVDNVVVGSTMVYASGPGSMITDLRQAVAACNSGRKVRNGDERFEVALRCDDRLEW